MFPTSLNFYKLSEDLFCISQVVHMPIKDHFQKKPGGYFLHDILVGKDDLDKLNNNIFMLLNKKGLFIDVIDVFNEYFGGEELLDPRLIEIPLDEDYSKVIELFNLENGNLKRDYIITIISILSSINSHTKPLIIVVADSIKDKLIEALFLCIPINIRPLITFSTYKKTINNNEKSFFRVIFTTEKDDTNFEFTSEAFQSCFILNFVNDEFSKFPDSIFKKYAKYVESVILDESIDKESKAREIKGFVESVSLLDESIRETFSTLKLNIKQFQVTGNKEIVLNIVQDLIELSKNPDGEEIFLKTISSFILHECILSSKLNDIFSLYFDIVANNKFKERTVEQLIKDFFDCYTKLNEIDGKDGVLKLLSILKIGHEDSTVVRDIKNRMISEFSCNKMEVLLRTKIDKEIKEPFNNNVNVIDNHDGFIGGISSILETPEQQLELFNITLKIYSYDEKWFNVFWDRILAKGKHLEYIKKANTIKQISYLSNLTKCLKKNNLENDSVTVGSNLISKYLQSYEKKELEVLLDKAYDEIISSSCLKEYIAEICLCINKIGNELRTFDSKKKLTIFFGTLIKHSKLNKSALSSIFEEYNKTVSKYRNYFEINSFRDVFLEDKSLYDYYIKDVSNYLSYILDSQNNVSHDSKHKKFLRFTFPKKEKIETNERDDIEEKVKGVLLNNSLLREIQKGFFDYVELINRIKYVTGFKSPKLTTFLSIRDDLINRGITVQNPIKKEESKTISLLRETNNKENRENTNSDLANAIRIVDQEIVRFFSIEFSNREKNYNKILKIIDLIKNDFESDDPFIYDVELLKYVLVINNKVSKAERIELNDIKKFQEFKGIISVESYNQFRDNFRKIFRGDHIKNIQAFQIIETLVNAYLEGILYESDSSIIFDIILSLPNKERCRHYSNITFSILKSNTDLANKTFFTEKAIQEMNYQIVREGCEKQYKDEVSKLINSSTSENITPQRYIAWCKAFNF